MTGLALTRKTLWNAFKEYGVITFGVLLYAVAWQLLLVPNGIASGGLTGICTVIYFATKIPVSVSFIILNVFLLIAGFLVLGRGFGIKTIYAILISTVFLDLIGRLEFLRLYLDNKLLIVIMAGTLEAFGMAFILERGASTGGTDIIALIINKFWPVTIGKVYLVSDIFIIASVLLVPGKTVEDMIYGYAGMIVFSLMVDYIMLGRRSTWQLMVFSEKYKEIADCVIKEMDRGVTALNSVGWYTGSERKVLLVLVRKNELHAMTSLIKSIDPKALVSVSAANTVYGEGFDEIKTGLPKKNKRTGNGKEQTGRQEPA